MVSKVINLGLRGLEFLWTLLIMSLVGNMIADAFGGNPSIVNYDMFVSIFAMLSLFYLIAIAFNEGFMGHGAIPLVLDVLNTLFFFCGAVATAAKLGVHSCGSTSYVTTNSVTNGSHNPGKRCHEAQAATAFLFFGFACFAASTFFSFLGARSDGVNLRSGGIRRGPGRV